jgi:hypothetical protein
MFSRQLCVATLAVCLAIPGLAQGERHRPAVASAKTARPAATLKPAVSTVNWEVYKNLTIAPGQFVTIESAVDFTGSDRAAVSYVNPNGDDLGGLGIEASWAVSGSDFWASTDKDSGGNFAFTNSGGSLFPVFGTDLRLVITNGGKSTVSIQQVTIYARSH